MNTGLRSKLLAWIPALLWMGLIFLLSSRPAVQAASVDWQDFIIKKTAHFIEYFILNFLLILALKTSLSGSRRLAAAFILSVIYAASDEFHQTLVPGREGRIRDVVIDSFGAAVSGLVVFRRRLL